MKRYLIDIEDDDFELGVDFNSLVHDPAHDKLFDAFEKQKHIPEFFQDEEQRIITGVAIAAGVPIFRNDKALGPHEVVFTPQSIRRIWLKFNKDGFRDNLNLFHDSNLTLDPRNDAFLVEQYIVDRKRGVFPPKSLEKQDIKDGSWIISYKIVSEKLWSLIKEGKVRGYSVEGVFLKFPANIKENHSKVEEQMLERKVFNLLRRSIEM